jgi:metal-sulfur cluster biosynthetic enzyme
MRTTPAGDLGSNLDQATILERLNEVLDPELDESIVKLGFVRSIVRRGPHVHVVLELPTSWCAITFAYIMAEDIRRALLGFAGIKQVTIGLLDHCAAQEIEAAVNTGRTFAAAFPQEAPEGLNALRTMFLRKGYLVRQERLFSAKAAHVAEDYLARTTTMYRIIAVGRTARKTISPGPLPCTGSYSGRACSVP